MSKSSARQRVTQLTEWMKTLKTKRNKPVKQQNNRRDGFKQR